MALPAGTVTLLFSDIEGSTRLLERLGERYDDVLDEHRRIVRGAIAAHGGCEVRTEGDAFFVAFGRAGDAVRAAVAAQRRLARFECPPRVAVRVRVGVHTKELATRLDAPLRTALARRQSTRAGLSRGRAAC